MWSLFENLYKTSQTKSGLYIGKKLTRDHVHLTSYSRMRWILQLKYKMAIYVSIIICTPIHMQYKIYVGLATGIVNTRKTQ